MGRVCLPAPLIPVRATMTGSQGLDMAQSTVSQGSEQLLFPSLLLPVT